MVNSMIMRLMAFNLASRVMSDVGTICVMPALLNNAVGSFTQNAVIRFCFYECLCVYINVTIIYIYCHSLFFSLFFILIFLFFVAVAVTGGHRFFSGICNCLWR